MLSGDNRIPVKYKIWAAAAFLLFCGSGALFLYFHDPVATPGMPKCVFHALTGLHCIGCGTTRAIYAALHGDFQTSFRSNVMLFPMMLLFLIFLWKPESVLRPRICAAAAGVLFAYWILRNIPVMPFLLLAPPAVQ